MEPANQEEEVSKEFPPWGAQAVIALIFTSPWLVWAVVNIHEGYHHFGRVMFLVALGLGLLYFLASFRSNSLEFGCFWIVFSWVWFIVFVNATAQVRHTLHHPRPHHAQVFKSHALPDRSLPSEGRVARLAATG